MKVLALLTPTVLCAALNSAAVYRHAAPDGLRGPAAALLGRSARSAGAVRHTDLRRIKMITIIILETVYATVLFEISKLIHSI